MCSAKLVQRGAWCRQLQEAKASATSATAYFRKPVQEANQLLANQITNQEEEAAVRLHKDPRAQTGLRETQSRQTAAQNAVHTAAAEVSSSSNAGRSQQHKQRLHKQHRFGRT